MDDETKIQKARKKLPEELFKAVEKPQKESISPGCLLFCVLVGLTPGIYLASIAGDSSWLVISFIAVPLCLLGAYIITRLEKK
jgi:hypothetical protein